MDYAFFIKLLRPYYVKIFIVCLFVFLQAVYTSLLTFSFKYIIEALQENNKSLLIIITSALFVGIIIIIILSISRDYLHTSLVENFSHDLRLKMFDHLRYLSNEFYARTPSENIMSYFSSNFLVLESALLIAPSAIVFPIISVSTNLVALFILNWQLAIVSIFICPLTLLVPHKLSKTLLVKSKEKWTEETAIQTITQESISMQKVIKIFRLYDYIKIKYENISKQLVKKSSYVNFIYALIERCGQVAPIFLQVLSLTIGVFAVYMHHFNIGTLVAFQTVFGTLIYSLMGLTYNYSGLLQGISGIQNIAKFINEPEMITEKIKLPTSLSSFKKISFKNVSFSYQELQPVLKDVTFDIKSNQFVAFVGESGCGKSTILNLLVRFYDLKKGEILIDGVDSRNIPQDSLHSLMSMVFQEPFLFNTTIKENILLGKLNATYEEMEVAAKAAEIHETILQYPNGYNEKVGERGNFLSGGQKQRVAIARAIIAKPQILILDEITSALDPVSEYAINNTINKLSKHCTIVCVTHRLDSVVNADRIFVLNNGKIFEQGSYDTLMKMNGLYKKLWDKQHRFVINIETDIVKITAERLQLLPLFRDLPANILEKIVPLFKSITYKKSDTIIREGDLGSVFYIIVRGKIQVYRIINGERKNITTLEDGDYFGEIALIKKTARTASVDALTPCLVLTLEHKQFMFLLNNAPHVRRKLEKQILRRS